MKKILVWLVIFGVFVLLPKKVWAADYSLATSTNWDIRYDGAVASDALGTIVPQVADVDGDGKLDLVIPVRSASNASRTSNGSVYIILGTLLESLTGTGNTIDLSDTSKYNLRFYGAATSDFFGQSVTVADFDGNGKSDIAVGAFQADFNSRGASGSVYLLRDSLIDDYTGTGNNIDVGTSTNYNLRFDGATASDFLGGIVLSGNIDNSGNSDLLMAASGTDYNSKGGSGSEYVVFDSLLDDYAGTGNDIDLGTSTNYNLRFDGAAASDGMSGYAVGNLNGSGASDLVLGSGGSDNTRSNSGSAWLVYDSVFSGAVGTGNNYDLGTSSNYNLRFDGPIINGFMSPILYAVGNFISTTTGDLVLNVQSADYNSRNDSGSVYIIYNTLLDDYSGTGNNIDLNTSTSYNLRYDGAAASDSIGATIGDVDGNGLTDLVPVSGSTTLGSSWIVLNSLMDDYSGTGNNVDLATSSNYNMFFSGAASGDGAVVKRVLDVNGDSKADLLIGAAGTDYNSRSGSGSLYVWYNFPHTVSVTSFSSTNDQTPLITGSVSVSSSSVTSLSGVEVSFDSNNPLGTWTGCTLVGTNFSCRPSSNLSFGSHTVYVRAYDTNTSYTAQSNYGTFSFQLSQGSGGSGSGGGSNSPSGYVKPITVGPTTNLTGGIISLNGSSVCPGIAALMNQNTSVNNLYLNPASVSYATLLSSKMPYPWQNGLNVYSQIYTLGAVSAFNGYPILTTTNPYTLIVCYDPTLLKGLTPSSLRLGYFDQVAGVWKQLPGRFFVDSGNQTVAVVTNQLSYFAVVYPNTMVSKTKKPAVKQTKSVKKATKTKA